MPRVQAAFLCDAATTDPSGKVNALGAFIDFVRSPRFPLRHMFTLVGRVEWTTADFGRDVLLTVEVRREEDETPIASVVATASGMDGSDPDPLRPESSPIVLPLPLEFPEPGDYRVTIVADDARDPMWTHVVRAVQLEG